MMKLGILFAGAAAFAFAGPALAKPGNGHGHGQGQGHGKMYGYGVAGCPPGRAKKAIPCVPPGQAKKMYGVGQRLPAGMFSPYSYNRIPSDLRTQYRLQPYGSYYYGDGYLYRVDPRTMLVQQVIGALLHR
jgi:hypothetical protein